MAGSTPQMSQPMSVKEISTIAQDFFFNPSIPLKTWLRTADALRREALIYEDEDNDQQAYLLLMRYAALVTETLPLHPSAGEPEHRQALKAARKSVPGVINRLEALKPRINSRYDAWQKSLGSKRESRMGQDQAAPKRRSQPDYEASDPAIAGRLTTLAAGENKDLAVKLAHKEIERRTAVRRATRQAGISGEAEQQRRTAGLWDDWEASLTDNSLSTTKNDNEIRQNMEATRHTMDKSHEKVAHGVRQQQMEPPQRPARPDDTRNGLTRFRYPSIPKSLPLKYEEGRGDLQPPSRPPRSSDLPPKPPKEMLNESNPVPVPPRRPEIASGVRDEPGVSSLKAPSSFTFRPSAYLENGNPLRTVFLPPDLREQFLSVATPNTQKNLETCGMLCGTLISNALFISKLVIPEQESTSDTCETINEGAFFDYCAAEDLMVLGWIHTHPTQTCFMSSRDLHTHCGYQVMMPESIAIVCAPSKNPSWGVFRLTDPPGMKSVLNCRKTGLFHPHDEDNIYTDALRPGHVFEAEGLKFDVVDLRP